VSIREQSGGDREVYELWTVHSATGEMQGLEVREAAAEHRDAMDAFFERSITQSRNAFDVLSSVTGGTYPESDDARQLRQIVPAPRGEFAVVLGALGSVKMCMELDSATEVSLPGVVTKIGYTPLAWSRDGRTFAVRATSDRWHPEAERLFIVRAGEGVIQRDVPIGKSVHSIGWSPTGSQVALLVSVERLGTGPIESLYAKLGHGVPYLDFSVMVVDVDTGSSVVHEVVDDVRHGTGWLLWDAASTMAVGVP
jgi:hypothetical protein